MSDALGKLRRVYARMPRGLRSVVRGVRTVRARRAALEALAEGARSGAPHELPGELIVSLTSYPPRFPTLHLTLQSLLRQRVVPDRIILWLADEDLSELPESIRILQNQGVQVQCCEDLRSFKKLVPAIEAYPGAYIVTADDDLYYPDDWLKVLIAGSGDWITARRAHRITIDDSGKLKPYASWPPAKLDSADGAAREDFLPTTGAGALFPPHSLHPDVTNRELFQRLCPDGDDLWFYWCARRAGTLVRLVGPPMRLTTWQGSQDQSLWDTNRLGGNDMMIERLENAYGRGLPQPDGRVDG